MQEGPTANALAMELLYISLTHRYVPKQCRFTPGNTF